MTNIETAPRMAVRRFAALGQRGMIIMRDLLASLLIVLPSGCAKGQHD